MKISPVGSMPRASDRLRTDEAYLPREGPLTRMIQYAVQRVDLQREYGPPGSLLLQPVAIEAAVEETKLSESSMEMVAVVTPRVSRP